MAVTIATPNHPAAGGVHYRSMMFGILLTLLLSAAAVAQEQRSINDLSNGEFVSLVRALRNPQAMTAVAQDLPLPHGERCGLGIAIEAQRRLPSMSPAMADELRSLLAIQRRQVSIVSPSGRFRINFDTSGYHAPALLDGALQRIPNSAYAYADSVAQVFDEVYRIEVEEYGFDPPPLEAGTSEYQITILEFLGTYYGQTLFNLPLPNTGTVRNRYATHMEIDNDFLRYETKGIDGLRVTAAHEFHHMIQLGGYGLWDDERWVHEMSSTYFEDAVYPYINDYVQYIDVFMEKTDLPMYAWSPDGYELALWPMFLVHKYGQDVMREVWEGLRKVEPVTAMRDAIRDHKPTGGDIAADFCSWTGMNYFTGYRADRSDPNVYADAPILPSLDPTSLQLSAASATLTGTLLPLSADYLRVFRGLDSLTFVVSNSDISSAIIKSGDAVSYELEVRDHWADDGSNLTNGWSYTFKAGRSNALCVVLLEGGQAASDTSDTSSVNRTSKLLPFPNPFYPIVYSRMHFPVPRNTNVNRADLYIFTVDMMKVVGRENVQIDVDDVLGAFVSWDGRGDDGEFLSTGVYFYYLKYGDQTRKGKIAVVVR